MLKNARLGLELAGVKNEIADERARKMIELVGLAHKRDALGRELSTGQRKRLEMARAMATEPRLLLLDEVTGGVDQPSIGGLIELVGRLRDEGVTLLVIEHNMRVIMGLADRILVMFEGRIVGEVSGEQVASGKADEKTLGLMMANALQEEKNNAEMASAEGAGA